MQSRQEEPPNESRKSQGKSRLPDVLVGEILKIFRLEKFWKYFGWRNFENISVGEILEIFRLEKF